MDTFPKKRLEAFVEAPVLHRFIEILDAEGVRGYFVMPVVSGSGDDGLWSREGSVASTGLMVAVVCILSPETLEPLLDKVFAMLSRHIGVVSVSDCEVIRPDRFEVVTANRCKRLLRKRVPSPLRLKPRSG